jgi:hypothetical protein
VKRWLPVAVGVVLLIAGLLCFVLGSFIQIIICDYPGCEDGRTQSTLLWYAAGVVSWLIAGFLLFRASRKDD